MLQDQNVERYVAGAIKPLQKQIKELKTEIKGLRQVKTCNKPAVINQCEHNNTEFKNIRCNVCEDCGDIIEIDV